MEDEITRLNTLLAELYVDVQLQQPLERSHNRLRRFAAKERERAEQAILSVANNVPSNADDGFYNGYKLAIVNALAAIRALG